MGEGSSAASATQTGVTATLQQPVLVLRWALEQLFRISCSRALPIMSLRKRMHPWFQLLTTGHSLMQISMAAIVLAVTLLLSDLCLCRSASLQRLVGVRWHMHN